MIAVELPVKRKQSRRHSRMLIFMDLRDPPYAVALGASVQVLGHDFRPEPFWWSQILGHLQFFKEKARFQTGLNRGHPLKQKIHLTPPHLPAVQPPPCVGKVPGVAGIWWFGAVC